MHLTDTQRIILNVACQRADRMVLPLPKTLKGGAVAKVIDSLLAKGLIAEVPADQGALPPSVDEMLWRETENGGVSLECQGKGDILMSALGWAQQGRIEAPQHLSAQVRVAASDNDASRWAAAIAVIDGGGRRHIIVDIDVKGR